MALMLNSPKLIHRNVAHDVNVFARSLSSESNGKDSKLRGVDSAADNHAFEADTLAKTDITLQDEDSSVPKSTDKTRTEVNGEGKKTCSNPERRRKVTKTVILLFAYSTMGMLYGQFGPTLPDLQKISGVELEKASWIFTGFAVGYLIGCLVGGILLEKFNEYLLVFLYTFGCGVVTAVLPWIPEFYVMLANRFVIGILIGGQDTATHTLFLQLWADQGGRFIHLTHILAAVGGTLAPLITEPFVLPQKTEFVSNMTFNKKYNGSVTRNSSQTTPMIITVANTESNIHFAFLITALITVTASFPVLYIFLTEKREKSTIEPVNDDDQSILELGTKGKYSILAVLNIVSCLATAFTDLFPSFLTTFLIEQLEWEQSTGTILTALYFSMYGFGNLISAIIYNKISTTMLLTASFTASVTSTAILLIGVIFNQRLVIWIAVALTGLSIAATLPALFTWTQIKVTPVTGRIASAYLFSGSAGVMANPLIMGYFMDNFSPMWFMYFSLGEPLLCLLLFLSAYVLQRIYPTRLNVTTNGVKQENKEFDNVNGNDMEASNNRQCTKEIYIEHL